MSSWEQFLGKGGASANRKGTEPDVPTRHQTGDGADHGISNGSSSNQRELPSIEDLFSFDTPNKVKSNATNSIPPSSRERKIDGVVPVSDLFFWSPQDTVENSAKFIADGSLGVDSKELRDMGPTATDGISEGKPPRRKKKKRSRTRKGAKNSGKKTASSHQRIVRRGMEMLIRGVPIDADPPFRSVQLMYDYPKANTPQAYDWAATISLNTKDFGPLLYSGSISKVTDFERGLFCEYFCQATLKWDISPKDLRKIVSRGADAEDDTAEEDDDSDDLTLFESTSVNDEAACCAIRRSLLPVPTCPWTESAQCN